MKELIDLDLTIRPVAAIKLFGKTHDVMPLDGRSQRLLSLMLAPMLATGKAPSKADTAKDAVANQERLTEIVAQVMPTLTPDDVERLTVELKMQIVQIGGKQIDAVKKAIASVSEKNAARPSRKKK